MKEPTICCRYAPSPTGPLHLGNFRTALIVWLFAKLRDGKVLLRLDDIDSHRVRQGFADLVLEDLGWLGLSFDGPPIYQSRRTARYGEVMEQLQNAVRVFPCRCSRKDIERALNTPDNQSGERTYPGTCYGKTESFVTTTPADFSWRFHVEDECINFTDKIYGTQRENLTHTCGDFVVKRKGGVFAYQLASVVDDIDYKVSHVIRGQDLLGSTARQIVLFSALNCYPPAFVHLPLLRDASGYKLSKRDHSTSLQSFKQKGVSADEMIGLLASSLGLVPKNTAISAEELLHRLSYNDLMQRMRESKEL